MKNTTTVRVALGDQTMTFETGLLARQAAGQATCQLGETIVFSAVSNTNKPREGIDYFPLQVEYRERFYAAGRFPGGYFKREGRPTAVMVMEAIRNGMVPPRNMPTSTTGLEISRVKPRWCTCTVCT